MVVVEALVLLFLGMVCGVFSTVVDVVVFGSASILSHFALWVLLNVLLAIHIDSRARAIWWAVPFNFGFFAAYFLTTVASFEGYTKSLLIPLLCVALVSPFLTYAGWVAKKEKNFYGRFLCALIVLGTLGSSYAINKHVGVYDVIMCLLLSLVLFVMPVRRLKISPAAHPVTEGVLEDVRKPFRRAKSKKKDGEKDKTKRRTQRSTKRRGSAQSSAPVRHEVPVESQRRRPNPRTRRSQQREETQRRVARRQARRVAAQREQNAPMPNATLGNARVARRSERSA